MDFWQGEKTKSCFHSRNHDTCSEGAEDDSPGQSEAKQNAALGMRSPQTTSSERAKQARRDDYNKSSEGAEDDSPGQSEAERRPGNEKSPKLQALKERNNILYDLIYQQTKFFREHGTIARPQSDSSRLQHKTQRGFDSPICHDSTLFLSDRDLQRMGMSCPLDWWN